MSLAASPCRNLCDWAPARSAHADDRLLACLGCGTQWRPGLGWTPRQADGTVPLEVLRADVLRAERREGEAGTSDS